MKQAKELPWFLRPPALRMDEYAEFIEKLLAHADPVKIARQKAIEKQIKTPFTFKPEPSEKVNQTP